MPTLKLNGINLHTQVLGEKGPLIFMCHGLISGSIATWYFQFAPSLARHYRVVLYDLRGHGKSEKPSSGYDLATMAADLSAVIQHYQHEYDLQDEPFSIVGHSYGALVALHYTLYHQEVNGPVVNSLVIVDAPLPASRFIYPGMKEIQTAEDVEQLVDATMRHLVVNGKRRRQNFINHIQYLYLSTSLKDDIAASQDIDDNTLASLSIPVKILYGQHSDCHYVGERLAKFIPNSIFKTMPCGHYITFEQPELLSQELNIFFGVNV